MEPALCLRSFLSFIMDFCSLPRQGTLTTPYRDLKITSPYLHVFFFLLQPLQFSICLFVSPGRQSGMFPTHSLFKSENQFPKNGLSSLKIFNYPICDLRNSLHHIKWLQEQFGNELNDFKQIARVQ